MKAITFLFVLTSAAASAQTDWTPPPMVPVPTPAPAQVPGPPPLPPSVPAAIPSAQGPTMQQPGTPPPPQTIPSSTYVPGQQNNTQSGYQYSPFSNAKQTKPGPEIGLMVSESLFGMLTAAGVTVLPYFLLFNSGALSLGGDNTISSILFALIFSAAPLTVAQTQVSLANGSRFYFSETWPAALAGLAAEAGVLALFYLTGWLPQQTVSGGIPSGGSVPLLLIGSIGVVPLIQMALTNLVKQPKFNFAAVSLKKDQGLALGLPMPSPILANTRDGLSVGLSVSLMNGSF
jgi:hypothetical protein